MSVTLPTGINVEFRDPQSLTVGERKRYIAFTATVEATFEGTSKIGEALLAMVMTSWTAAAPLPRFADGAVSDAASFDELATIDFDALVEALTPFRQVLFPSDEGSAADPKAATPA